MDQGCIQVKQYKPYQYQHNYGGPNVSTSILISKHLLTFFMFILHIKSEICYQGKQIELQVSLIIEQSILSLLS